MPEALSTSAVNCKLSVSKNNKIVKKPRFSHITRLFCIECGAKFHKAEKRDNKHFGPKLLSKAIKTAFIKAGTV